MRNGISNASKKIFSFCLITIPANNYLLTVGTYNNSFFKFPLHQLQMQKEPDYEPKKNLYTQVHYNIVQTFSPPIISI